MERLLKVGYETAQIAVVYAYYAVEGSDVIGFAFIMQLKEYIHFKLVCKFCETQRFFFGNCCSYKENGACSREFCFEYLIFIYNKFFSHYRNSYIIYSLLEVGKSATEVLLICEYRYC